MPLAKTIRRGPLQLLIFQVFFFTSLPHTVLIRAREHFSPIIVEEFNKYDNEFNNSDIYSNIIGFNFAANRVIFSDYIVR